MLAEHVSHPIPSSFWSKAKKSLQQLSRLAFVVIFHMRGRSVHRPWRRARPLQLGSPNDGAADGTRPHRWRERPTSVIVMDASAEVNQMLFLASPHLARGTKS